jgi:hypothetical protein
MRLSITAAQPAQTLAGFAGDGLQAPQGTDLRSMTAAQPAQTLAGFAGDGLQAPQGTDRTEIREKKEARAS